MDILVDGKNKELTVRDQNGTEWTKDLIGDDPNISFDDDLGEFVTDQESFDYWALRVDELDTIEDLKKEAFNTLSPEDFTELQLELRDAGSTDIEMSNHRQIGLLEEALRND